MNRDLLDQHNLAIFLYYLLESRDLACIFWRESRRGARGLAGAGGGGGEERRSPEVTISWAAVGGPPSVTQ